MAWFVMYVKGGAELDVIERVGRLGINAYCPVDEGKPRFKNYVFVRESSNWRVVLDDSDVWYILVNDEKPVMISDRKINQLASLPVPREVAISTPRRPRAGDEIIINSGLLEGCRCYVLKAKKHNMFLVEIGNRQLLVPLGILDLLQ